MAGHVLHIGAHPDDEDAGLIAYMAHKHAVRTVYWSATRGEGGQNRLGAYAGDALGVYRTWESLAARAIDGGESLYGPFYDFGYSKNGADAMAKWGRQELVREIVRAIRLVQPQLLIARFVGDPSDGHGHHQAVGSATVEAFDAAADETRFPELALPAWRAAKFYQSTGGDWQPGEKTLLGNFRAEFERDGFVRIDTGELDPIAGLTYQQQAWIAFNCHRTQAMGFLPERGSFFYYYRLKESRVDTGRRERSFYDGLDPTLSGLVDYPGVGPADLRQTLEAVLESIDAALHRFHPEASAAAAEDLLRGLHLLQKLRLTLTSEDEAGWAAAALRRQVEHKIAAFEELIVACLGLDVGCVAERARVAGGERFSAVATLWNPRGVRLDSARFSMLVPPGWTAARSAPQAVQPDLEATALERRVEYDLSAGDDAVPTTPYWLREPRDRYRYRVPQDFACEALGPAAVSVQCELTMGGQQLRLRRPALMGQAFPGGYRALPVSLLPEVSVAPQNQRLFLPVAADPRAIDLHVALHRQVGRPGEIARLQSCAPDEWFTAPSLIDLPTGAQGESTTARFRLTVPGGVPAGCYPVEYRLGSGEGRPAVTVEPIWMAAPGTARPADAATCVREAFLARPARVDIHTIDARFAPNLKYAYVRGATEGILDALSHFGLSVHVIQTDEMDYLDLSVFDAIIIGPNAYLIRDEVRKHAHSFLDYVSKGGTLIVQYQAYGYERLNAAPYPFDYSHPHDRVTHPDAQVTILEPRHSLMTYPNPITADDFTGWVHDRGLYFFGTFDDRYAAILGCSDIGEDLKPGGLVACGYGRGAFAYVGYSLFRQIPSGVPGAFRLFANLLGLPEALLLERADRLKQLSFFSQLSRDQLMAVARIVFERHESKGTYLCRQGDPAQELFIIAKGEVEIIKRTPAGTQSRTASQGQVIGEFAILADIPRTADLRAASDIDLLVISGVHFRALLRQHADIAENMIRQLVLKLVVE